MWFMVREFNQRQTFWRRLNRVLAPLVGLTLAMAVWAASPALEGPGPVEVELYENLPEPPQPEDPGEGYNKKYTQHTADDIDLTGLRPSMRYTERAFGFPGIPTKFSKNGLALVAILLGDLAPGRATTAPDSRAADRSILVLAC